MSQPYSYVTKRLLSDIDVTSISEISYIISLYKSELSEHTKYHLGYPYNLNYDYSDIKNLLNFSINNLGDPFIKSNYK